MANTNPVKSRVLNYVNLQDGEGVRVLDVVVALSVNRNSARGSLLALEREGSIERAGKGVYRARKAA